MTGAYRLSKAKAARLLADLFGIPLSPGQVCATKAEVGQQLRPVVEELVTAMATVYPIVTGCNRKGLLVLVGPTYRRVLPRDHRRLYDHWTEERHQLCWAHLWLRAYGGDMPSSALAVATGC